MGNVLQIIDDELVMELPAYLFRTEYMWGDLSVFHRNQTLEEKGYDGFWKSLLEDYMWQYDASKFCEEGMDMEECWENDRINMMTMIFYHTEWADDRRLPVL